jgi:hypothetical protein
MKEYGVLYAKVVFPINHRLFWISNCYITNILPKGLREEIKNLSIKINTKYKDVIIVPIDNRIMPGCITKPESIDEVSKAIYEGMLNVFKKTTGEDNCIRLVYGVGEMNSDWIENKVESTHEVGSFPIMVKIGHFLDYGVFGKRSKSTYEFGLYKV